MNNVQKSNMEGHQSRNVLTMVGMPMFNEEENSAYEQEEICIAVKGEEREERGN